MGLFLTSVKECYPRDHALLTENYNSFEQNVNLKLKLKRLRNLIRNPTG